MVQETQGGGGLATLAADHCVHVVSLGFEGKGLSEWPSLAEPKYFDKEMFDEDSLAEIGGNVIMAVARQQLKKKFIGQFRSACLIGGAIPIKIRSIQVYKIKILCMLNTGHVWDFLTSPFKSKEQLARDKVDGVGKTHERDRVEMSKQLKEGCLKREPKGEEKTDKEQKDEKQDTGKKKDTEKFLMDDSIGTVESDETSPLTLLSNAVICFMGVAFIRVAVRRCRS